MSEKKNKKEPKKTGDLTAVDTNVELVKDSTNEEPANLLSEQQGATEKTIETVAKDEKAETVDAVKSAASKAKTNNSNKEALVEELAASEIQLNDVSDDSEADYSDISNMDNAEDLQTEKEQIQAEFVGMDNVINGTKRKQKKRKKKMSKRGKMMIYSSLACVCIALLSVVAYFLSMFLGTSSPTQRMDSSKVIVDMTDRPFYFGTVNTVELTSTFVGGSNFKIQASGGSRIAGTKLTVSDADETFVITYDIVDEATAVTPKEINCIVVPEAVNVSTWDELREVSEANQVICMQDDVESPVLFGEKRADHGSITIKNDVYGNGKIINLFELVCTRSKTSSKKYGEPYLAGNGKIGGDTGMSLRPKEGGGQLIFQDVHVTGNNMSREGGDTFGLDDDVEYIPTADGDDNEVKKGNMVGLPESTELDRGVLLFSRYGDLVNISGDEDLKIDVRVEHCVFEKSAKVVHVTAAKMDLIGCIIRDAADTALSIATSANKACYIKSSNNVIANSLTGGILFYCYDGSIDEKNAAATWNTFEIVEGTFLDIYNWKKQDGLAFLPETEDFASIANPIAASEIPKASYNSLKGHDDEGNLYIHFAIIKIRTGGGLPKNSSTVVGYKNIKYSTCTEKTGKGFPIPSIANAIMKEIDVWGYYDESNGDVTPTLAMGTNRYTGEVDWENFYKELREGRQPAPTTKP